MATSRKARGAAKKGIALDFSGVETQANLPEQDFVLEVDEVELKTSNNSGENYLSFTFKVAEGKYAGKKVWHNCSLQPQALFNLRGVLEALGLEVPQGPLELDPADLIGMQCGGAIQNEMFEGKKKARVVEFFPADDVGEEGEPDEEEAEEEEAPATTKAKPAGKGKAKPTPEPEPEEEEDDEAEEGEAEEVSTDLTWEEVQEAEKEDLIELAEDNDIKLTLKQKKDLQLLRDTICAALELEAPKPVAEAPAGKAKRTRKAKALAVGSAVTFTDDEGEVLEGNITSIDGDDVTVEVDDEEWELSMGDLTAA